MPAERVDYSSDEEFQQAQQWEQTENNQSEPDAVPCYFCECQMYQEHSNPEGNVCENCNGKIQKVLSLRDLQKKVSLGDYKVEEIPF